MSDEAARFVGGIPQFYDQGLGPVIFVDYAADIAARAAEGGPARVLETAAGTGIVTRRLRDALPAASRLVATDLNAPMLEIAREKFRPGEAVEFRPADAQALPFDAGSFEAVVSQFGIMFYPDKGLSHREVHRVLAPGGRYLFSVWDKHRYNPFARIAQEVTERFFPDNPPQFYRVPFSCHRIDPIKEDLLAAGFIEVSAHVLRRQKRIPDLTAFARGMVFGIPLVDQVRARGGDPERVFEAVLAAMRDAFGDPGEMPLQAILFSARKG